ncbi:hypothetical protein MMAD_12360 [Mycolicibacterium madagascariense]|uniref:Uncharacterized protein n=1 Tax=Mycolicibacterium madagascariense TaxID=212765 RepID=A0A7I7XDV1_9MYCO|nr:hypothetical protein [Mycolicibacterium madagascariense]MCV7013495.1 hypothetical protein [Mycolicibacterium madagascariense]BBZ26941.1 hypothetical protein MMAD_12360 [Mycolicibacterium madagascariense]
MAEQFDVTARLAEGRPTVDDVEEYVAACRSLGYQHRDLTAHPTQVRDWYDGDDGMDLRVLDADHRALSAAALAAEEAASRQADLAAQLTAGWAGRGGAAADEFLSRSCQAAQSVSAAVRRAADAAAALPDALWHAVDEKVAATEAVAGSQAPHRVEWLAAARTVTRSGADLDAASELVRQRVMPFVDADVASDWVGAMRAAMTSIDAAYDAACAAMASLPRAVFEVPGDLGPEPPCGGALRDDPVARVFVAQTIPAAFSPGGAGVAPSAAPGWAPAASGVGPASAGWTPAASGVGPASAGWAPAAGTTPAAAWAPDPSWSGPPPAAAPPPPPAPVTQPAPPMGDLGVGTQGSGVSGLGQQLADLLSGLVGSAGGASSNDDALDGNPANDPAADDDPDEKDQEDADGEDEPEDDPDGPDHDSDAPAPEEKDPVDDGCAAGEQPAGAPPAQAPAAAAPPTEAPPTEAPPVTAPPEPPPPAAPPPEPAPPAPAAEQTPCEKAADAVPQVGE